MGLSLILILKYAHSDDNSCLYLCEVTSLARIDSTLMHFRFRQTTTVSPKLMQSLADSPITTHQRLTGSEPNRVLAQHGVF